MIGVMNDTFTNQLLKYFSFETFRREPQLIAKIYVGTVQTQVPISFLDEKWWSNLEGVKMLILVDI